MNLTMLKSIALITLVAGVSIIAIAQGRQSPEELIALQVEAMKRFDMMDGEWRGPAKMQSPSGEWHELTQTERVGPFLHGSVKVIEGRGYEADGSVGFNALGIISYDPGEGKYTMRSYARGHVGDHEITPTENGFYWEMTYGPMRMRYTATIENDKWFEIGERFTSEGEAIRFFEMTLTRIGDSSWPASGAVLSK